MTVIGEQRTRAMRAAIYARVSDRSQAEEDKTSTVEQISEMEAYCERTEPGNRLTLPGGRPRLDQEPSGVSAHAE